ncbi:hypothetical protein [Oceanospirillum sediminis]|uniref:AAA domain-containing protein n=1 Tax=Oceanospirillum sediminis TaxID=2760088 RepID=A0A839ISD5_9GAMM|nr:hypothetical protein [Oceanospirillum sediminis]MBB1487347.1 hypothetical protein [Oceanospirillum sediminis]
MRTALPVHYVEVEHIYQQLEKKHYRTISVTACHGQSGTSLMAYALSKRYQADGYKVLLVDLNLQHPALDAYLGLPRKAWQADHSSSQCITAPSATGTHFLTAPTGKTASLSFRNQSAMHTTLGHWLEDYDRVILDTSPLNAKNYRNIPSDTVCGETDATLLMIASGKTTQNQLEECCTELQEVKANLVGCIMNDQHHPTLAAELIRETKRLKWLPPVARKLRSIIDNSSFLNLKV